MAGHEIVGTSERSVDANGEAAKFLEAGRGTVIEPLAKQDLKPLEEADLAKLRQKTLDATGTPEERATRKMEQAVALVREGQSLAPSDFNSADRKYTQASELLRERVLLLAGGNFISESLLNIRKGLEQFNEQAAKAATEFKDGKRELSPAVGQPGTESAAESQNLRSALAKVGTKDLQSALSPDQLSRILNESEKKTQQELVSASQAMSDFIALRMMHTEQLSEYGFKANDESAKEAAKHSLLDIIELYDGTYETSAELAGARMQARQGKQIEMSNGKAASLAYLESAKEQMTTTTLSELTRRKGDTSPAEQTAANAIAMSILLNKQQAADSLLEVQGREREKFDDIAFGAMNVGITYMAGHGLGRIVNQVAAGAPPWVKTPLILTGAVLAGGTVDNYIYGRSLYDAHGFTKTAALSALTYGGASYLQAGARGFGFKNIWSNPSIATAMGLTVTPLLLSEPISRKVAFDRVYGQGEKIAEDYRENARKQMEKDQQKEPKK